MELNPCPFCGSTSVSLWVEEDDSWAAYVYCEKCKASGPEALNSEEDIRDYFAIKDWNYRKGATECKDATASTGPPRSS